MLYEKVKYYISSIVVLNNIVTVNKKNKKIKYSLDGLTFRRIHNMNFGKIHRKNSQYTVVKITSLNFPYYLNLIYSADVKTLNTCVFLKWYQEEWSDDSWGKLYYFSARNVLFQNTARLFFLSFTRKGFIFFCGKRKLDKISTKKIQRFDDDLFALRLTLHTTFRLFSSFAQNRDISVCETAFLLATHQATYAAEKQRNTGKPYTNREKSRWNIITTKLIHRDLNKVIFKT